MPVASRAELEQLLDDDAPMATSACAFWPAAQRWAAFAPLHLMIQTRRARHRSHWIVVTTSDFRSYDIGKSIFEFMRSQWTVCRNSRQRKWVSTRLTRRPGCRKGKEFIDAQLAHWKIIRLVFDDTYFATCAGSGGATGIAARQDNVLACVKFCRPRLSGRLQRGSPDCKARRFLIASEYLTPSTGAAAETRTSDSSNGTEIAAIHAPWRPARNRARANRQSGAFSSTVGYLPVSAFTRVAPAACFP